MGDHLVHVPISLLLSPDLPAPAKLIGMVSLLGPGQAGTTRLSTASGLSRPTVIKAVARLRAAGWDLSRAPATAAMPQTSGLPATVSVPAAMLCDRKLGVQARLLYGILTLTPGFSHSCGSFTLPELATLAQVSPNTVAKAVEELVRAEWIRVERANRRARTYVELIFPGLARGLAALAAAQHRLEKATYYGEGLMREYLSLMIDSAEYEDDAAPGFLVNPRTAERLQLDRYYPPSLAFEFQGPQHHRATARFSAAQSAVQRERDLIKLGLCVTRGITLVEIHPEDLTLKGMQAKVEGLRPARDLVGYELLVQYLEEESHRYRRRVARI